MAFTPEQLNELKGLIGTAVKEAFTPDALGAIVKPIIDTALKPVNDKLATAVTSETLEGKLAELKAAPKDDKNKDDKDGDDPVAARLEEMAKKIADFESERTNEKNSAATRELVVATLKAKKPNLKGFDKIAERIIARGPKDADGVMEAYAAEEEYFAAMGIDVKTLSADPKAEGGESGGDANDEAKRIEQIKSAPRATL